MEKGSDAYKIEFLLGQVHGLSGFVQALAVERPDPRQLSISA
ncbi:hypothetical protein FHT29_000407 [Rhizobium sp. SG741]|nr:hypothetical protein [Rhizobium sp. SG741]